MRLTPPSWVNLTALERRLFRICMSRTSSACRVGMSGSTSAFRKIFFSSALNSRLPVAAPMRILRLTGPSFSVMRSASILERSRMSLISWRRFLAFRTTRPRASFCLSVIWPKEPESTRSLKPMIELSGVRSSWDILARKSDLVLCIRIRSSLARPSSSDFSVRSRVRSATFCSRVAKLSRIWSAMIWKLAASRAISSLPLTSMGVSRRPAPISSAAVASMRKLRVRRVARKNAPTAVRMISAPDTTR